MPVNVKRCYVKMFVCSWTRCVNNFCKEEFFMNVMLLFLSEYKEEKQELFYRSDLKEIYIAGTQTADAPTKYFLQYIKQNKQQTLDEIFCITSKKVYQNGLKQYKNMVSTYCEENQLHQPNITSIAYDFNIEVLNEEKIYDLSKKVNQLYNGLSEKIDEVSQSKEKIHMYIDYTGGLRDVSFLMVVLMRYLEFNGLKCEKVIYSNWNDREIVSIDYIYQLFYVINGISEFIQSGNSILLRDTVLHNEEIAKKYPTIKELLDAMNEFSNMIALCVVDNNLDKVLKKLKNAIVNVQQINVLEGTEDELAISMLKNLLGEIEKKLLLGETESLSYLQIIKWCLSNNMIQQAITFYIEKIPKLYYDTKLINWIDGESKGLPGHDEYSKQFYDILYDEIGKNSVIEIFRELVSRMAETGGTADVNQFLSGYEDILKKEEIEKIRAAEKRIEEYLDLRYIHGNGRSTRSNNKVFMELDTRINAGAYKKAWNAIKSNKSAQLMFLENKLTDVQKENTYQKKLAGIHALDEADENAFGNISNADLKEILEYYLTLKIIRNQINHASENDDENEGIHSLEEYLKQSQKEYSTEINIENIKTIISRAIDKAEQLISKVVQMAQKDGHLCEKEVPEAQEEEQLGDFAKVSNGEQLVVKVVDLQEYCAIVEDRNKQKAEWKLRKMSLNQQEKFHSGKMMNQVFKVKYVDKISKKCPYMVEE